MALGGFLGGLANLGTAYGGYLGAQNLYDRNQLQQLQLQDLQAQQMAAQARLQAARQGLGPLGQPRTTTTTPTPGPLQPLTTPPTNLLPSSYSQPPGGSTASPLLPPVPPATAQLQAPIPGLDALGGGTTPSPGMMGVSPYGPGQPFTGPAPGLAGSPSGAGALAGGLVSGLPSLSRQLADDPSLGLGKVEPLADVPGPAAPEEQQAYSRWDRTDGQLRGPPPWMSDIYTGALSLGQPTLGGFGIGGAGQAPWERGAPLQMQGPLGPAGADQLAALRQPLWRPQTPLTPPQAAPQIADTVTAAQRPDVADTRYAPDQWGGKPQPQPGTFRTSPAPVREPGTQDPSYGITVRGSWFGNAPGWSDPSDTGRQASGLPVAGNPGIALPDRSTLGQMFDVTTPDGRTFRLPQTDTGPAKWTGRGVDINAAAAEAMGYTPGTFPTDGEFTVRPAGGGAFPAVHAEMSANLSPEQHAIGDRGLGIILGRMPQIPQMLPMANPQQVAQLVDRQFPGTSDAVKGAVFVKLMGMMNEEAKEQTAVAWRNWQGQMEQLEFAEKVRHETATEQEGKGADWEVIETGDPQQPIVRANRRTGQIAPMELGPGAHKLGAPPRTTYSQPFQQRGADGQMHTFRINNQTNQVEEVKLPGEGPVTRLGAPDTSGKQPEMDPQKDTLAKGIAEYRIAPLSGWALRTPWGKQTMENVLTLNPDYEGTEYGARQSAARGFAAGRQGDAIRFVNTAYDHLAVADDLATGLANNDIRLINKWKNVIKTEFGYEGPLDFEAAKVIVGDEVTKAVVGSVGSLADRQAVQTQLQAANSPEQLKGVMMTLKRLMMGQLSGLQRQYESTTGKRDFDQKLSPAAKDDLGKFRGAAATDTSQQGGSDTMAPGGTAAMEGDTMTYKGKTYHVGDTVTDSRGHVMRWNGGSTDNWEDLGPISRPGAGEVPVR